METNEITNRLIFNRDHAKLCDYQSLGKSAARAIPMPDHYFPLLYPLALQAPQEDVKIFNDKAVLGSITMTSVRVG
ncbi:MAG: hypothetical protein ACF8AM_07120 [Rhodopirellula sp. JB055]|uniref:hypothetical protein n=1 Tax=Rhodopirellula sp. JB055 TaxID=3342846 RepID=UPI00370BEF2B